MALIETMKQRIHMLEQGTFQNMCNALLAKEGYGSIMSLGSQAGTQKTTKGTPDAYFVADNGQYIFVEYTTQEKNIANKIKEDIEMILLRMTLMHGLRQPMKCTICTKASSR